MNQENPYEAPSVVGIAKTEKAHLPVWRRLLGSACRIGGGIVIGIPLVAIGSDFYHGNVDDYIHDLPAVSIAVASYFAVGSLLIFVGSRMLATAGAESSSSPKVNR